MGWDWVAALDMRKGQRCEHRAQTANGKPILQCRTSALSQSPLRTAGGGERKRPDLAPKKGGACARCPAMVTPIVGKELGKPCVDDAVGVHLAEGAASAGSGYQ